jgi:hypothetical protein
MGYKNKNNSTGKNRICSYINDASLLFLDAQSKGLTRYRSESVRRMINEHMLCENLTGKTVWQVIKDNIELRKEILKLKRYE